MVPLSSRAWRILYKTQSRASVPQPGLFLFPPPPQSHILHTFSFYHHHYLKKGLLSFSRFFKNAEVAQTGVPQWVRHHPANLKVAGSIPSRGTCLGCEPGPWLGACERQPLCVSYIDVSPPLSLPSSFSKNK